MEQENKIQWVRGPRLLDQMRAVLRVKHYSLRTEKSYLQWARRFILFHRKRHPREMGAEEVRAFLSYLAIRQRVSASTQNQALNALVFLYKHVLNQELGSIDAVRARRSRYLPTVLTREETQRVFSQLSGESRLICSLLYGSGLRLMECMRLRVKDLDFAAGRITVRDGKGFKDRITVLPESLAPELKKHLIRVKALHEDFCKRGLGGVELPYALERKYPRAGQEWGWQYVFPARNVSSDPRSGARRLYSPAGGGHRYPHRAGTLRAQGPQHDHDLHPCDAKAGDRRQEPPGRSIGREDWLNFTAKCRMLLPWNGT